MVDYRPQSDLDAAGGHGHEANVLKFRGIIVFAVALVVSGCVIVGILSLVMHGFSREEVDLKALTPPRFRDTSGLFPSPRLQPDPNDELVAMRREASDQLNSYGWVNRNAGVAHIPIDRAMAILASRGLPKIKAAVVQINGVPSPTIQHTTAKDPTAKPEARQETKPR